MSTRIKIALFAIVLIAFTGLWAICVALHDKNVELTAQIEKMKADAKTLSLQYDNARKQAEIDLQQAKEQTDAIMLAEVPKKCKEAVKWSVKQAKLFTV